MEKMLNTIQDLGEIGDNFYAIKVMLLVGLGIVALLGFINMLFLMVKLDKMEKRIERIELKMDIGRGGNYEHKEGTGTDG